jgi:glucose-1-phosphate cytidylyltransferase
MTTVIFAGGIGSRISEESILRPKPMIEIGGKPILWHIMKIYSHYGFTDFVICLGYKGHMIKEYFINYFLYNSDLTVELHSNQLNIHYSNSETFKVTLIDTGVETNTAGRLKKVRKYVENDTFMLTYGDGVSNVNLNHLVDFHKQKGKLVTLTTIQPPGRFGTIEMTDGGDVLEFQEKSQATGPWINAGYMVLEPGIFDYLSGDMDAVQWEKQPLVEIANAGQLAAYKHDGFWKCMDAMRDKVELEEMWQTNAAKWKIW